MSVVEQFLLKTEEIDEEFRLWITSEPNDRFPIGLLQVKLIDTVPSALCVAILCSSPLQRLRISASLLRSWLGMAWLRMIGVVCR